MAESIDVTVVIVSYNTRDMTKDCLTSVFENMGRLRCQVVVIDNGSTDGSVEMISQDFPLVDLVTNVNNRGFAAANNQGFDRACGRFFLLLNSDTIVLGEVFEKSVEFLERNVEVGAMGCRVLNTDRTLQRTCSGYPTLSRLLLQLVALDRIRGLDGYPMRAWPRVSERDVEVISGCYMMVRKEVVTEVGGLDERFFFFGEETDWCLQMRKAGWKLRFAPVGDIIHHGGGSVKKLNHRRDLMLTSAIVRLHHKNSGFSAAVFAFIILFGFNLSRAIFWALRAAVDPKSRGRAVHFLRVASRPLSTWPR